MTVICVDAKLNMFNLTLGKEYKVYGSTSDGYHRIKDDRGIYFSMRKNRFKTLQEIRISKLKKI